MTLQDHFDAMRAATEPSPGRLARIRAGRSRRVPWGRLALAAVAVGLATLWLWPEAPEPVQHALEGVAGQQLGPHVHVHSDGTGEVSGHAQHLTVQWRSGSLQVEVVPERGVQLQVVTDEAVVRVVGTAFDVTRDALGTQVAVTRGQVALRCADGPERMLTANQSQACPPVDAAGWLRRVTALQVQGRHREVVDDVGVALQLQPPGAIALELRLHRLTAWVALGETVQAAQERAVLLGEAPQAADRIEAAAAER
ncbi:MAG: FecR domain-containing protein [Myxococcales bacterium]|nr:FecR domain-containing protein [Myxococcales bacterium]